VSTFKTKVLLVCKKKTLPIVSLPIYLHISFKSEKMQREPDNQPASQQLAQQPATVGHSARGDRISETAEELQISASRVRNGYFFYQ
jgi:hypothetical protein